MTFKQAVSSGWQNKFVFSGRSTRSAFWFWYLFYAIVILGSRGHRNGRYVILDRMA